MRTQGTFALVNATDAPLEGFPISVNPLADVSSLLVEGASIDDAERDRGHSTQRLLSRSLRAPGRPSVWDLEWANPGFRNSGANNRVVANGTFVDNTEVMPFPGYDASRELDDNNVRREHDLPPVQRLPKLGDPEQLHINQFSVTQRTNFRTVLSTSEDQTAIAPGYLRKTWTEGGRRYFTYEMDAPIWPFLSFMSARYEVKRDQWNDVALEVYYHPDHHYNVDRMLEASKISLDYFERAFTPYQYRQFRIMEFPGYQSFAQAFPNTVPFSESIGFVADLRDDKDIDYVFYVTAHELAHQWWGHQAVGARMQGMTFIIETLAQYSALMVMEETYGRNKMRRFLKHELDIYLRSRGGELIEELPLVTVENQGYVHYRKGSVAMYALKEAIGEAAVNAALRSFLERWGFREDRYPTSRDLIAEFRAQAGEAHQDLITDLFERIAVYDVRTTAAESVAADAGFETTVTVSATKLYADGDGVETEAPMAREVVVGLYPERSEDLGDDDLPEPLRLETVLLESGDNTFTLASTEAPARVVVDPQITLVDRNPTDNERAVTRGGPPASS